MNRFEFARKLLEQPVSACPFLNALDSETRAKVSIENPDPHTLPEEKLLDIALHHGVVVGVGFMSSQPGINGKRMSESESSAVQRAGQVLQGNESENKFYFDGWESP